MTRAGGRSKPKRAALSVLILALGLGLWAAPASALPAPTALSPSGTTTDNTPTFSWNAVAGATWYKLAVDDSGGRRVNQWFTASQAGCAGGSGTCSVTPGVALAQGNGTWWVRAWNSAEGSGPWSGGMTIFISVFLAAPAQTSPTGKITDPTPAYSWSAVAGATWYKLAVNDANGRRVVDKWFQASDLGCGGGTGTCSVTPDTALAPGNGTWWVRGWNALRGNGPWSAGLTLRLLLTRPAPLSPSGAVSDDTPTFQWNAAPGATWYQLQVDDSTGNRILKWLKADDLGCGGGTGTCSFTPNTTLNEGAAKWWVQGWNAAVGSGPWTARTDFTISVILGPPVPTAPSGTVTDPKPAFTWNAVPHATWYQLAVDDATGRVVNRWVSAADLGCGSGTGTCTVPPKTLLAQGSGTWWVRAWNATKGTGPWSGGLTFTVNTPLTPPVLLAPGGTIQDPKPAFRWNPVTGATWYQLAVDDATGRVVNRWFSAAGIGCGGGTGTCSAAPAVTLAQGSGTWWVRGWNSVRGTGPWSGGLAFTVSTPLTAPVPIAPTGDVTDTTPAYRWNAVVGATWYQLAVNDAAGRRVVGKWFQAADIGCGTGTCSATPPNALPQGGITWWVRGWNALRGNGPWSAGVSFTVVRGQTVELTSLGAQGGAPGSVLTLNASGFDPASKLSVRFFNAAGFSLESPALNVTSSSLQTMVPPFIGPGTAGSNSVSVKIVEKKGGDIFVSNAITGFPIGALPALTLAPGSVTANVIGLLRLVLTDLQTRLSDLEASSGGKIATAPLRTATENVRLQLGALEDKIRAAIANPGQAETIGEISGASVKLDQESLRVSDQWIVALAQMIIGNGGNLPDEPAPSPDAAAATDPCAPARRDFLQGLISDASVGSQNQQEFQQSVLPCTAKGTLDFGKWMAAWTATIAAAAATLEVSLPLRALAALATPSMVGITFALHVNAAILSINNDSKEAAQNLLNAFEAFWNNLLTGTLGPLLEGISKKSGTLFSLLTGWEGIIQDKLKQFTTDSKNFVAPKTFTLTVGVSGPSGSGSVSSSGGTFPEGTVVTVTASANTGFKFTGWSGACSGTGSCTVTMNANKSVTATFAALPTNAFLAVGATPVGGGSVSGTGISCPGDCTETYALGTKVTLTAAAADGFYFKGWSGACSGRGACALTMDADKGVTATFSNTVAWTVSGSAFAPGFGIGGSFSFTFTLPLNGGSVSRSGGGVTGTFSTTRNTFTVSGFGLDDGFVGSEEFTCSGSGGGSSAIAETQNNFSASGTISGSVTCRFRDIFTGDTRTQTSSITGSFSANAPK